MFVHSWIANKVASAIAANGGHRVARVMLFVLLLAGCYVSTDLEANGVESLGAALTKSSNYYRAVQVYAYDGKVLQSPGSGAGPTTVDVGSSNVGRQYLFVPVTVHDPSQLTMWDGDTFRLLDANSQYLRNASSWASLGSGDSQSLWRLERVSGANLALNIGEKFRFAAADDGNRMKSKPEGLRILSGAGGASEWTFGCWFPQGPFATSWQDGPTYKALVLGDPSRTRVQNAVNWLKSVIKTVQLPTGSFPLVMWTDSTITDNPLPVGYLVDDTLWASRALVPYDGTLADQMKNGLLATGHYGDGMTDTLFHSYPQPYFKQTSSDTTHGNWLGDCNLNDSTASGQVQVRAWSLQPDSTFTTLAQLNADTAVYLALNTLWQGNRAQAITIIRTLIADTRATQPDDPVFWDAARQLLVDSLLTLLVHENAGTMLNVRMHAGNSGAFPQATFKLALVLYAARLLGLAQTDLAPTLAQMWTRLWLAQKANGDASDGGMAHAAMYGPSGAFLGTSWAGLDIGPTGEATASTILAHTAQQLP